MADSIVGMMFARNEADILPMTITEAMKQVDSLFIADDGSTDGSWDVIQYFAQQYPSKVEYVRNTPDRQDQGQRNSLLNEIRRRYKPENTWVQTIEADIVLNTVDLKALIERENKQNVSMTWHCMNAIRGYWEGVHQLYPHWPEDIRIIMDKFHWLEEFPAYTYRPLPGLYFDQVWRPWPRGLSLYQVEEKRQRRAKMKGEKIPIALHYGFRGPTHMMAKWNRSKVKPANPTKAGVDYTSIDTLMKTSNYFNGVYNRSENTRIDPVDAWYHRG